ncbi:MAG: hypothetical protein JWL61_4362 [Gemmatimonadetes bacterium]|nr:hypothetical protein [Gemmatimonadota bacterium]
MKNIVLGMLSTLLFSAPLTAQVARAPLAATVPRSAACTYLQCALGIAPAWNGLDVVDGATGRRVASLGFFWPHRVDGSFAGSDSAISYATKAFRVRRTAAAFTDVGVLLLGYAGVRQVSGGLHGTDRVVGILGAGAFAVGVPLQFSADGLLSRAVWWHNSRF